MERIEKEIAVNRIVSGIFFLNINGQIYKYANPTKKILSLSDYVYLEALDNSKFNNLLTRKDLKIYLQTNNIWTSEDEDQLKTFETLLDDLKVQLYEAVLQPDKQATIRRNIKNFHKKIEKHTKKKHILDHMTLENYAENIKQKFITCMCISDFEGNNIYSFEDFYTTKNFSIYQECITKIYENILSVSNFREIARTNPFRNLWSLSKSNIYNCDPLEWTHDQQTLLIYSKMYDNVYDNPERPDDKVIEDDDMLDGWFIKSRREAEKERKKKEANDLYSHNDGNGDLFIMANSQDAAKKITGLNDIHSRMKMKQRDQALQEKGKLEPHQLPDIKQELKQEAMRQMADRFKK